MQPMTYLTIGIAGGIMLTLIALCIASRNSKPGPDPERRTRTTDRRRRFKAAKHVEDIANQYGAEAITYPQATTRLRALEVPADIAKRVLTINN